MGVWGKGLFNNDLSRDIEDLYVDELQRGENDQKALAKVEEEILQQLTDYEEKALFSIVFAYVQWKYGRLSEETKANANQLLNTIITNPIHLESDIVTTRDYCRVRDIINSEMPKRKNFIPFCSNPWDIGDVYAYQIHSNAKSATNFRGKYIIIQKVADTCCNDTPYSVVRFLRAIFDIIPSIDQLRGIETLPLVPYIHPISSIVPPLDFWLKAYMCILSARQFPKKYLHYIGKIAIKNILHNNNSDSLSWVPNSLEDAVIHFYLSWEGKKIEPISLNSTEWI